MVHGQDKARNSEELGTTMEISIVCTNFNKGQWIRETIEGFLMQEFSKDFEIILVDDCSTDISKEIISEYANNYPHLIKAFFHEENQGIAKTWVDACNKASGRYIARCDGDDYWTDSLKLQKQYDALEQSNVSLWCNTDFDIIKPDGEVVFESAFQNEQVVRMDSYEKMLAYKGFTMSSTWLVETKLMLSINETLDLETSDDTFNLQLELFQKTQLITLNDSTTVYRLGYESDSHPVDLEKFIHRHQNLLETQLKFLAKYPDANLHKLSEYLFQEVYSREVIVHQQKLTENELKNHIRSLGEQLATISSEKTQLETEINVLIGKNKSINDELSKVSTELTMILNSKRWKWISKILSLFRR